MSGSKMTKKEYKEVQKQMHDALATLRVSLWNQGHTSDINTLDSAINKLKQLEASNA